MTEGWKEDRHINVRVSWEKKKKMLVWYYNLCDTETQREREREEEEEPRRRMWKELPFSRFFAAAAALALHFAL